MNRAVAVCFATLLVATGASALPDLVVTIPNWSVVPGTTRVQVQVIVQNKSAETANMQNTGYGPIDVLTFATLDQAPVQSDSTPYFGQLDAVLAPNAQQEFDWEIDYGAPGTYTLWALVDSIAFSPQTAQFAWPEASKTNNLIGPITIVVPKPVVVGTDADLVITDFTAEVNASQVKYSVTVKNQGASAAKAGAKVDVLVDTPGGVCPPPAWSQQPPTLFGNVFADVGGLAVGATKTIPLIIAPGVGTHTSCAVVDLDDVVVENDEANNTAGPVVATVADTGTPSCPDLIVSLLDVAVAGNQVTFTVKVKNIGTVPSTVVALELFYASLTAPVSSQLPDQVWSLVAFAAGEENVFTATWTAPTNAERTAWVAIDLDGLSPNECKTDNNVAGPFPYQVLTAPDRPDLVVESLTWQPSGSALCYEVTVANKGTADATGVQVDVFFDLPSAPSVDMDLSLVPSGFIDLGTIAAGQTMTQAICWEGATEGKHQSWAVVDFFGFVAELDETNNLFGPEPVTFVVPVTNGPDLVVMDYKGNVDCTVVNYLVKVCNVGDVDAQHFAVDLYYDALDNPGFNGTKYGPGDKTVFYGTKDAAAGLAAGACIDIILDREDAPSGTYQSWIVVDTNLEVDEVTEENPLGEGNNIAFVNVSVDAEGCRCLANETITTACLCGTDIVSDGYCCNGAWQADEFAICIPEDSVGDVSNPEGDNPADGDTAGGDNDTTSPGDGDGISGPYGVYDVSGGSKAGISESCDYGRSAPSQRGGLAVAAVALLLALARRRLQTRR